MTDASGNGRLGAVPGSFDSLITPLPTTFSQPRIAGKGFANSRQPRSLDKDIEVQAADDEYLDCHDA
jgi:hypothetical protein